jgi:hypothetical protein
MEKGDRDVLLKTLQCAGAPFKKENNIECKTIFHQIKRVY